MNQSMFFMIALQVILIALNAVFACAEIAVISFNDRKLAKLAAEGDKRALRLARLTSQPARFLATIQVAITLSGFLGSAFAAENFSGVLVDWVLGLGLSIPVETLDSLAVVLITILLSYFTLVFGELVPKQLAMRKAEALALGMSGLISGISRIFAPLVSFLTLSTNAVLRLLGVDTGAQSEEVSEEEILMMVDAGSEKGTIDNEERDFIQNVFAFDNLTVEEIITHRTDVTLLYLKDGAERWEKIIGGTRFTYYPVCGETPDKILGVLNTKVYFRLQDKSMESILRDAVFPAYFVPETITADLLLRNMRRQKAQFAVVMDEYGGMSGIITIKDLLERLVGELEDDVVPEQSEDEQADPLENGLWKVGGGIELGTLSSLLGITLPEEGFETLNGLICHSLGYIPQPGESLESAGLEIQVEEVEDHQVKSVLLRLIAKKEK